MNTQITPDTLQAFADAWNRHDLDALMSFMADDCVFEASAGDEVWGTRYAGRELARMEFGGVATALTPPPPPPRRDGPGPPPAAAGRRPPGPPAR